MEALFTSGHIADLVIAFMIVEAVALLWMRKPLGLGIKTQDVVWLILPGLFLVLALRGALVAASWKWVAAALICALAAHIVDLRRRSRRF